VSGNPPWPLINAHPTHGINAALYVAKYVSFDYRTPNPEERRARRIAKELKVPTEEAIRIAAPAMAALIDGPCWLVPVPASDASLTANLTLARAIVELVPGAHVKCAVARAHRVECSYHRRLRGLPGLTAEQHAIIRNTGPMQPLPLYFVDNVITTGTTTTACRRALGWGAALVYADGSTPYNTLCLLEPTGMGPNGNFLPAGSWDGRHQPRME
jgi:hypothetical protein